MSDAQPTYRQPPRRTERPAGWRHRDDETVGCPICGDTRWVELVDHNGQGDGVRPCERCKPDTYARWEQGRYSA